jgi:hypothetical protein
MLVFAYNSNSLETVHIAKILLFSLFVATRHVNTMTKEAAVILETVVLLLDIPNQSWARDVGDILLDCAEDYVASIMVVVTVKKGMQQVFIGIGAVKTGQR